MAIDYESLPDYTFAQIKRGCKYSMMAGTVGGVNLSIEGRTVGRYPLQDVIALYNWADAMEAAESGGENGGGVALGQFGDAQ